MTIYWKEYNRTHHTTISPYYLYLVIQSTDILTSKYLCVTLVSALVLPHHCYTTKYNLPGARKIVQLYQLRKVAQCTTCILLKHFQLYSPLIMSIILLNDTDAQHVHKKALASPTSYANSTGTPNAYGVMRIPSRSIMVSTPCISFKNSSWFLKKKSCPCWNRPRMVSIKIGVVNHVGNPPTSICRTYSTSNESGPVGTSVVLNKCVLLRGNRLASAVPAPGSK